MNQTDKQAVLDNFVLQHTALVNQDWQTIDGLLSEGFTRTHITGRTQNRDEWLRLLKCGDYVFHDIELVSAKVNVDGPRASLNGKIITDATIFGERRKWKLQLRQTFLRQNGKWLLTRTVATTWH